VVQIIVPRFDYHNHTDYSNIRLVDSINTPKTLVERALKIGLSAIAITEHESLGNAIDIEILQEEVQKEHPDFQIVHGNEIYLVESREPNQPYFHFVLLALDATGFQMLSELSSGAWLNGFYDRGMMRVPTLKSEVEAMIQKYGQGHLFASTACLGGELAKLIVEMSQHEKIGNKAGRTEAHDKIVSFLSWCINTFGKENIALEVQPAVSEDQLTVNNIMPSIAAAFDLPICITSDAHYLTKEDQQVHKAFLNSKDGDREVDEFYAACWLQSEDEIRNHIKSTPLDYEQCCANSMKILERVQPYSLRRAQEIPQAPVPETIKKSGMLPQYPTLSKLYNSDNPQERYWVNECVDQLEKRNLTDEKYLARLEEEADTMDYVGKQLNTCVFAYPLFMKHYIDLIWECGSTVGCGRGCFLPNTNLVTMGNGKAKKIEDVQIGDYVRTIDGSSQRVTDVLSYACDEDIYKISVYGNGNKPLKNTNNHQYWVMKNEACPYDREYCTTACARRKCCRHKAALKKEWIRSDELSVGDYVFYPWQKLPAQQVFCFDLADYCRDNAAHFIVQDKFIYCRNTKASFERFVQVNEDFLYLLGVCIGDGCTILRNGGKLSIAFNSATKKDVRSLEKCETYLSSLKFSTGRCKHKQKNLIQLYCYNAPFASLMRELIGKGVKNKQIPKELLYDNRLHMSALLSGLLASDGSYDKAFPRFSYDGINYNLISQVKMLCSYFHMYSAITTRPAHKNNKESFKLRASGKNVQDFLAIHSPYKVEPKTNSLNIKNVILDEDGYWVKIKKIEKESYQGEVYDLTVENNHNYIVNNITVHNSAGGGLSHYLLGITQTSPFDSHSFFWRFLNKGRIGLPDIDVDVVPSKREKILQETRKETGELGCVHVCTYGVLTTKAAIKCAARGYRSYDYPEGIPLEEAEYLTSLVPAERGFLWTLSDAINGNPSKGRKPNKNFVAEIEKYPGLKEILFKIEGLVVQSGIHASGVIYPPKSNYYRYGPFMRAKDGTIVTQYSLHRSEDAGSCKIDWLVTEVQAVITDCVEQLQKAGHIEPELTLRQAYDKYLAPDVLPLGDNEIWDEIDKAEILKLFQLNSDVGRQGTKLIKPRNIYELTAVNALIRLMAEDGAERPMDKYVRFKANPQEWEAEMDSYGLSPHEKEVMHKHLDTSYGICYSQEQMMLILMDEDICGFDLKAADAARKCVAKKKMSEIPAFKEKVLSGAKSPKLGKYVWDVAITPSLGYSFNMTGGV
jgi:DNA polymerase III alpha subunit